MSVYEFINSKDVRSHWEKRGFTPNALESAWLIWQSKNHLYSEKREAWQRLLDSSEDMSIPAGLHDVPQESLHGFIRRYLQIEDKLVSDFYKEENGVAYSYSLFCEGDDDLIEDRSLFPTFKEAYEAAMDDLDLSPAFYEFTKSYMGADGKRIILRMNCDGEVVKAYEDGYLTDEKDYEIFYYVWDGMRFEFPIPFKRGDIVTTVRGKYRNPKYMDGTFALNSPCYDSEDMEGYFVCGIGDVCHEHIYNSMELELASRELKRENKMIIAISNYLKGKTDLAHLMGAYKLLIYDETARIEKRFFNYTREDLRLSEEK